MASYLTSLLTPWTQSAYIRPAGHHILAAGLGGAVAISLLAGLSSFSGSALLMAPLGATAVLVFGLPGSPLSGPRHVIGGHALSMGIGLLCLFIVSGSNGESTGGTIIAAGLGTGLAIAAMMATRTVHPPAGANPVLLAFSGLAAPDAAFLIALPGIFGAVLLYLVAALIRRALL